MSRPAGTRPVAAPRRFCAARLRRSAPAGAGSASASRTFDSKHRRPAQQRYSVAVRRQRQRLGHRLRAEQRNPGSNGIYKYDALSRRMTLLDAPEHLRPCWLLHPRAAGRGRRGNRRSVRRPVQRPHVAIFDPNGAFNHAKSETVASHASGPHWLQLQPDDPCRDRQHEHLLEGPGLPLADLARERRRGLRREQRPVDFPATASYINDNKLTGTPSGPFGEVGYRRGRLQRQHLCHRLGQTGGRRVRLDRHLPAQLPGPEGATGLPGQRRGRRSTRPTATS